VILAGIALAARSAVMEIVVDVGTAQNGRALVKIERDIGFQDDDSAG
jgi:hypothetical protein